MTKDEMIKDMADRMDDYCQSTQECPHFRLEDEDYEITCSICRARSLYNANYRKVGEDEIVIKKSEYDTLLKGYTLIYDNAYQWGLKVGEEKAAIEILQEFLKEFVVYACVGDYYTATEIYNKIQEIAKKYGIELE